MPLVTRLHRRRVVLSKINTGFGTDPLWAGEYRDDQDRPLDIQFNLNAHYEHPVVTDSELDHVLKGLLHIGLTRRFRP